MTELEWLKRLNESLWPKDHKNGIVSYEPSRKLTKDEFKRIQQVLGSEDVALEMICTNMFGGVGLRIYEHEPFPDAGAELICLLIEEHLPIVKGGPSRGACDRKAYAFFRKFAGSKRQREFAERYRLRPPSDVGSYDY